MFNMLLNVLTASSEGKAEFFVRAKSSERVTAKLFRFLLFVVFEPSVLKSPDHNVLFQLI